MIIDLKDAPREVFEHFKGGEKALNATMFFDGTNRVIFGELEPGSTIGYHKHEGNCEFVYILEGNATVLFENKEEYLTAGQCHYCPEGYSHSLMNVSDEKLVFLGIVPKQ